MLPQENHRGGGVACPVARHGIRETMGSLVAAAGSRPAAEAPGRRVQPPGSRRPRKKSRCPSSSGCQKLDELLRD